MSLRINHNISALNGHRHLLANNRSVASSLEKLSSGLQINRASDDAAGLVISEQMRAQINGLDKAIGNSETAVSMIQTAEAAFEEMSSLLNKARSLALHAANDGANDDNQLLADQAELDNIIGSLARISSYTQFATKKLLDGSLDGVTSTSAGIDRVRPGNLVNNPAINARQFTVEVEALVLESHALAGGNADVNQFVFSTPGVTGVETVSASSVLASGSTMLVTIDERSYRIDAASGGISIADALEEINERIEDDKLDFIVEAASSGGISVSRTTVGAADFDSAISFSHAERASGAGTDATSTLFMANAAGNTEDTASVLFSGIAALDELSGSTNFGSTGVIVSYQVLGQTGLTTANAEVGAMAGGDISFAAIMADVETDIRAAVTGLSGATISYTTHPSGIDIVLDSNNDQVTGITFEMTFDFPNQPNAERGIVSLELNDLNLTSGQASGLFDLADNAALNTTDPSGIVIQAGTSVFLDINGEALRFYAGNDTRLDDAATQLQGSLDQTFGVGTFEILAISGETAVSGLAGFSDATTTMSGAGFVIRTTNPTNQNVNAAIYFDTTALTGTDFIVQSTEINTGTIGDTSFNLETLAESGVAGVAAISGQPELIIANASGSTIFTQGDDQLNATLTTSSGLNLALTSTTATREGATLTLVDNETNRMFDRIAIEVDSGVMSNGALGSASLTFETDEGALFQIGANAFQTAGVAIDNMHPDELGRNVARSRPLKSLADLDSTAESALTNGLAAEAILVIDAAIDEITVTRGRLGAFQSNTLESGLNSLRVANLNLISSESTIRDVDFAAESAEFTRNNILVQSATAMLAQANQLPQNVLQLLS